MRLGSAATQPHAHLPVRRRRRRRHRSALDAYLSTDGAGEGDPDGVDRAGDVPLFASSIHIFMKVRCASREAQQPRTTFADAGKRSVQIKSCIKRCTQLNTGQTFFHLSRCGRAPPPSSGVSARSVPCLTRTLGGLVLQ